MTKLISLLILSFLCFQLNGQSFFFGADMSYVNEVENCGVTFKESQNAKDPYAILNDHGGNIVRLRLWHTPKWYDDLNDGSRFSDFEDVKISIARAKAEGLNVLLDFHLSDNWADPSKQLVPEAWLPVVDDVEILKDSLYNYIYETLTDLHSNNLLPEMIQIGNETNKGILLSPADNAVWTLDWNRNAILFNRGIEAVRDFEQATNTEVEVMIHCAGPANAEWLMDGFVTNGVTDFDVIGLSYYWAWHQPTTNEDAGNVITMLKNLYPNKSIMVVETGYIWTTDWNDNASNIISDTHPDYQPASPENQRDWLIDMTQEVKNAGAIGVVYWEPFWVSSNCWTQWGQGSHQEHAAYFDFENNLILPGGIEWMTYDYDLNTSIEEIESGTAPNVQILSNSFSGDIKIRQLQNNLLNLKYLITDTTGHIIFKNEFSEIETNMRLPHVLRGIYIITIIHNDKVIKTKKMLME